MPRLALVKVTVANAASGERIGPSPSSWWTVSSAIRRVASPCTTYEFVPQADGRVDVTKTLLRQPYLGGEPVTTVTHLDLFALADEQPEPEPEPSCDPLTCASAGAQCGSLDDGCGAMLDCGGCNFFRTCSDDNQCVRRRWRR